MHSKEIILCIVLIKSNKFDRFRIRNSLKTSITNSESFRSMFPAADRQNEGVALMHISVSLPFKRNLYLFVASLRQTLAFVMQSFIDKKNPLLERNLRFSIAFFSFWLREGNVIFLHSFFFQTVRGQQLMMGTGGKLNIMLNFWPECDPIVVVF